MLRNIFLLALGTLLFIGCVSSNQQSVQSSKNNENIVLPKNNITYFNLSIAKSSYIINSEAYQITVSELRKEIISSLKKYYPNAIIDTSLDSKKGIRIYLEIVDFAYVSGAKRFLTGSIAGNARLNLDIKFENIESNKIILKDRFATSSSKWGGIFAATTGKQIKSAAEYVIQKVNSI